MLNKVLEVAGAAGLFLLRKVLLFSLAAVALVGLSFLVWKPFGWTAYSERLIWTGIGIGMVAGVLAFGEGVGGRTYGIPTYTAAQSSTLIDWNIEIRQKFTEGFDYRIRIFLIGLFVFLAGVLVYEIMV
jgi:hypothetical protein